MAEEPTSHPTPSACRDALSWAQAQVAAARDDPEARVALLARTYHGPTGRAPRHLPFRRAALSFMRWQAGHGLPQPPQCEASGERLVAGDERGPTARRMRSDRAGERPQRRSVLRGRAGVVEVRRHPDTVVLVPRTQRQHRRRLLEAGHTHEETLPERFFINVALVRVLYAHALVAAPRLALALLAPLSRVLGDPRLGMAGAFLSLRRVIPNYYPLDRDVEWYIADEQSLGRLLDYAVIAPRLQRLYEWSTQELGEPRLLELVRDGSPIYAWPYEKRYVLASFRHTVPSPGARTHHPRPLTGEGPKPASRCSPRFSVSARPQSRVANRALSYGALRSPAQAFSLHRTTSRTPAPVSSAEWRRRESNPRDTPAARVKGGWLAPVLTDRYPANPSPHPWIDCDRGRGA